MAGQVMVGAVASVSVTVKLQVPVFPLWSTAVTVTVLVPSENTLPLDGTAVTEETVQLSVALVENDTVL